MRKATLEIDTVLGCEFPPPAVIHHGQTYTLESIFADAGLQTRVIHSQPDLPPLPGNLPFDRAELHKYMVRYRNRERVGWYAHVLITPLIEYLSNFRLKRPLGVMYDYRSNDLNNVAREGCGLSYQLIAQDERMYLRTLAHELGHVFNLLHPKDERPPQPIGTTLMNQAVDLQLLGNFPDNIEFAFNEYNKRFLTTAPADYVRPGGVPFADRPADANMLAADEYVETTAGLKFTVSTRQNVYMLGEPIYLRMALRNESGQQMQVDPDLSGANNVVEVTIITPTNQQMRFKPCYFECVEPTAIDLSPGAELLGNMPIFYGAEGHICRSQGVYKVGAVYQASVQGQSITAVSNLAEFEVYAPRSEEDLELSDLFMNPNEALFLILDGGDHLRGAVESLERLVRRYGDRSAAAQVKLSLARHFITRGRGRADLSRALELASSINEEQLDYEQQAELHGFVAIANSLLGDKRKARSNQARFKEIATVGLGGNEQFIAPVQDMLRAFG